MLYKPEDHSKTAIAFIEHVVRMYPYYSHTALHQCGCAMYSCSSLLLHYRYCYLCYHFPNHGKGTFNCLVSLGVKQFSSFRSVFGASSPEEVNEEIPGWEVMGITELRFLETTAHWGTLIHDGVDGC
jgi:hypothetical protein